MTPIFPVIPSLPPFTGTTQCIPSTHHQPERVPLYALRMPGGTMITRWRCSWGDRLRMLITGNLWMMALTYDGPLPPVNLETRCPMLARVGNDGD